RARDVRLAYLLLAPALLLLLTALAYPVGWEVWTSLTDLSPLNDHPTSFVGLDNYRRLSGDPAFWRAAANTVAYAALTSAVKLARQLVHRDLPAGRDQRGPAGAVRVRGARVEERVAALLAGDGAVAQAVPGARGVPGADHGVRRPRQRVDADRRAHRLSGPRNARLLARDPRRSVRPGLGPFADPGPVPPRRPVRAVPDVRSARAGAQIGRASCRKECRAG